MRTPSGALELPNHARRPNHRPHAAHQRHRGGTGILHLARPHKKGHRDLRSRQALRVHGADDARHASSPGSQPHVRGRWGAVRKAVVRVASRKRRVENRWNLGWSQIAAPVARGTPAFGTSRSHRSAAVDGRARETPRVVGIGAPRRALAARPSSSPANTRALGSAVELGRPILSRRPSRCVAWSKSMMPSTLGSPCASSANDGSSGSGSRGPYRSGPRRSRASSLRRRPRGTCGETTATEAQTPCRPIGRKHRPRRSSSQGPARSSLEPRRSWKPF